VTKKVEKNTFDQNNENEGAGAGAGTGTENKVNEILIQKVWKVKAFCEAEDLDKLDKHILEEKDSKVYEFLGSRK